MRREASAAAGARALDVLVVEDDLDIRELLAEAVRREGHHSVEAADGAEALARLAESVFDAVLLDVKLPRVDGLVVLKHVREHFPRTVVALMTGFSSVPEAVAGIQGGAVDYVTKPFDMDRFPKQLLARLATQRAQEAQDSGNPSAEGSGPGRKTELVGRSAALVDVLRRVESMARSDAAVLITGESGTGKELVARILHEQSHRKAAPFVPLNCAAFPEALLEAELFGFERGAFTGAHKRRHGRFKAADGGTLFLDEVAELPPQAQAKLLRVLQEGTFEPLGTNASVRVDVRVVSATHRNLRELVAAGRFREDLLYRLRVLEVKLPPLRERAGDVPLLVEHYLTRLVPPGAPVPSISPGAWSRLLSYSYPGNVRELANVLEHAVVMSRGETLEESHLPGDLLEGGGAQAPPATALKPLGEAVREFERDYLAKALAATDGNRSRCARLLGISRKSLWEKLRHHGLSAPAEEDYPPAAGEPVDTGAASGPLR